jgi:hypothetical protein
MPESVDGTVFGGKQGEEIPPKIDVTTMSKI